MAEFGYALSSEEHGPKDLVQYARRAEEAGFDFALISDHYLPWTDRQGNSPFAWAVIGGISQVTERLRLGTGVTCPTIRIHPAIIAQAAATAAIMMSGRFFLGVGTGEYLNEHITGAHWPTWPIRAEMLEEAVQVIRELWTGGLINHYGKHYTLEYARLYSLPDTPLPIMVAASGREAAAMAGKIGDGLIATGPDPELVKTFEGAGGASKPRFGQVPVCWARSEAEARHTARELWPTAVLGGTLYQDLPRPEHFEAATRRVTEEDVAQVIICGPDPERHVEKINKYIAAGYDHVYIHQIGPDQEGFFRFYEKEVLPRLR